MTNLIEIIGFELGYVYREGYECRWSSAESGLSRPDGPDCFGAEVSKYNWKMKLDWNERRAKEGRRSVTASR